MSTLHRLSQLAGVTRYKDTKDASYVSKDTEDASKDREEEMRKCTVFLIGPHGSGKSSIVSSIQTGQSHIPPSPATFGYEVTPVVFGGRTEVNVVEFTDVDNSLFEHFVRENIDSAVFVFVMDLRHPELFASVVRGSVDCVCRVLRGVDGIEERQSRLKSLLRVHGFESETALGEGSLNTNPGSPFIFYGSHGPQSSVVTCHLRRIAVEYGGGVVVGHHHLLDIAVPLAFGERLSAEVRERSLLSLHSSHAVSTDNTESRDKTNVLEDSEGFFIPAGVDSLQTVGEAIALEESLQGISRDVSEGVVTELKAERFSDFIERLSHTEQTSQTGQAAPFGQSSSISSHISSLTSSNATNKGQREQGGMSVSRSMNVSQDKPGEGDFLSQFE